MANLNSEQRDMIDRWYGSMGQLPKTARAAAKDYRDYLDTIVDMQAAFVEYLLRKQAESPTSTIDTIAGADCVFPSEGRQWQSSHEGVIETTAMDRDTAVQALRRHGVPVERTGPLYEVGTVVGAWTVFGFRITPRVEDNDDGQAVVSYPRGWEYQLGRLVDGKWTEYGWVPESELLTF